jgi:RNA polymerase sigma factor (TIGR02999 family)
MPEKEEITRLLNLAQQGNLAAESRLIEVLYADLRRVARACLRSEPKGHTLQATALVHEAFGRLRSRRKHWKNRTHYLSSAMQAMRQVLVDYARARRAQKRGGDASRTDLDASTAVTEPWTVELLDIDRALTRLSAFDERVARVVELRFFVGCTDVEIGTLLGVSERTVKRDWDLARAWLEGELASYRDERRSAKGDAGVKGVLNP